MTAQLKLKIIIKKKKKETLCTVQSQIKARKLMTIFCISQET